MQSFRDAATFWTAFKSNFPVRNKGDTVIDLLFAAGGVFMIFLHFLLVSFLNSSLLFFITKSCHAHGQAMVTVKAKDAQWAAVLTRYPMFDVPVHAEEEQEQWVNSRCKRTPSPVSGLGIPLASPLFSLAKLFLFFISLTFS
jgi:hypothetical protein